MRKIALVLLIVITGYAYSFGQNVRATASIDTNNVLIGDQVKLTIKFETDKKVNVVFPAVPDTIGKVEVLSRSKIDTSSANGKTAFKQTMVVTSFDSGRYVIPGFVFMYEKPGMTTMYPAQTDTVLLKFNTIPVDTAKGIKDIKPPMRVPLTFWDYFKFILLFIIVAAILVLAWLYWQKRKNRPSLELDYDPKIPPHVLALEALRQLDHEKLWQHGQIKMYYIRLTEILRKYMERRFHLPALEMTSDEIVDALRQAGFSEIVIDMMKKVFDLGDLAKFAKYQPYPDENSLVMSNAVDFVNWTIPAELKEGENRVEGDSAKR